jgi:hypothetical protein
LETSKKNEKEMANEIASLKIQLENSKKKQID